MNVKNHMTAIGNLGRDVEVRHTQSGSAVATFPLPIESGWGDNKHTSWLRCTLFGKRAEGGLIQYLVKGQQVAVSGELKVNQYQSREGVEKTSVDLIVNDIALIGGRPQQQVQQTQQPAQMPAQGGQPAQQTQHDPLANAPAMGQPVDDDIPF